MANGGTFANGYTWNGSFFAASGYRSYNFGALSGVGTGSFCWSACSYSGGSDESGFRLLSYNGDVRPRTNGTRAYGFPVRAVRE